MVRTLWLCFVPLFVAVDAIGVLPMYLSLTADVPAERLPTVVRQSVVTATVVALGFLALGPWALRSLGITVADFMIAGGILLLVISLSDLLSGVKRQRRVDAETLGAVPIGVPLITGPAVLTTCVLLANQHGKMATAAAVVANTVLAGVVFHFGRPITRRLGQAGTKTISKIASLLLAAIAVMLIRRGVLSLVPGAS
ncbi:MAG: MarC family protein [Lentisphaeria bacterium]|nr:MarC family protein [Lentisphaeria bacterium]